MLHENGYKIGYKKRDYQLNDAVASEINRFNNNHTFYRIDLEIIYATSWINAVAINMHGTF